MANGKVAEELLVSISADVKKLQRDLGKVVQEFKSAGEKAEKAFDDVERQLGEVRTAGTKAAEKIESEFKSAGNKAEQAFAGTAKQFINVKQTGTDVIHEIVMEFEQGGKKIQKIIGTTSDSFKKIEKKGKEATQEVIKEFVELENKGKSAAQGIGEEFNQSGNKAKGSFNPLKDEFEDVEKEGKEAAQKTEDAFEDAAANSGQAVQTNIGGAFANIRQTGMSTATAIGGAFAAIGAGAITVTGFENVRNIEDGMKILKSQLQLSEEQLKNYRQVAEETYKKGFSESIGDVLADVSYMHRYMGEVNQELLQGLQATKMDWGNELDSNEILRTISVMTKNFEELSETEALDMINKGMAEGLNFSGELLDTYREYGIQFKEMGYSAADFFAILKAGKDSGAWNLDKVGDAVKENFLRMSDMGATQEKLFGELFGIPAQIQATVAKESQKLKDGKLINITKFEQEEIENPEFIKQISAFETEINTGGERAQKAYQKMMMKIMSISDEGKRREMLIGFLGTQAEDLSEDVIKAMMQAKGDMKEIQGTTKSMEKDLSQTFKVQWKSLMADMELMAAQLFKPLLDKITEAIPDIKKKLPAIGETLANVFTVIGNVFNTIYPIVASVVNLLVEMYPKIKPYLDSFIQGIQDLGRWITETFTNLNGSGKFEETISLFQTLFSAISNILNSIKAVWEEHGQLITGIIMMVWDGIMKFLQGAIKIIEGIFVTFSALMTGDWDKLWQGIQKIFTGAWDLIVGAFQGVAGVILGLMATLGTGLVESGKGLVKSLWEGIKSMGAWIQNQVAGFINGITGKINNAVGKDIFKEIELVEVEKKSNKKNQKAETKTIETDFSYNPFSFNGLGLDTKALDSTIKSMNTNAQVAFQQQANKEQKVEMIVQGDGAKLIKEIELRQYGDMRGRTGGRLAY